MKKYFVKVVVFVLISVLGLGILGGCSPTKNQEETKKTVRLGYVNWAEGVAMTNLAKVILEDKMGYEVEMTMADAAPIFTSIANGNYDAFLDAWLPVTHKSYMEKYGEDLEDLGYNFEGARIGLVVPQYVEIDSIEEMNGVKEQFKNRIIGIDSGAGIMKSTDQAIDDYGLEYDLIPGSDPTMTAALKKAIDNDDWVVVTGWAPHWKFATWELKFLEDPKGTYGDVENIHTIARKGIKEDMPEVAQFLENFKLDDQQLGDLMGAITESDEDEAAVAKEWMNENEDLVNSWIPKE